MCARSALGFAETPTVEALSHEGGSRSRLTVGETRVGSTRSCRAECMHSVVEG